MTSPLNLLEEIFLHPGDHCFADRNTIIRTVLGSCVSITFWHPQLLTGGMCHYMLPERGGERRARQWAVPNGRFADEAIALLLNDIDAAGVSYKEYQVKLFGGGSMFPESNSNSITGIGIQNVQAARRIVKQHGLNCVAEHLGGSGYRYLVFEVGSGDVWVKQRNQIQPIIGHETISRALG